jgi:hypothetical protein
MKKTVLIRFAVLPLLLLCFVSCQSDRIRQELLAVETYLNAEPEMGKTEDVRLARRSGGICA